MKLLILLEVDVSATLAGTMQRSGFTLAPDGTGMQIKIPNSPSIPQRKINTVFVENPPADLKQLLKQYQQPKVNADDAGSVTKGS